MRLHLSNQTSRSKPAQYRATSACANRRHPTKERSTSPATPPQKNHRDSQEGIHHQVTAGETLLQRKRTS